MIKVSVIVPVYNNTKSVKRCIDSLVNQTLNEIEIILVNDCSTDNTLDVLKEYKEKYNDRIVIVDLKENKRPGGARNAGLEVAKGKYVGFVDSDDYVENEMYEILYDLAVEKDYDMADCGFFNDSQKKYTLAATHDTWGTLDVEKRMKLIAVPGFIWSKIIKRSIFVENNLKFREKSTYEDVDFLPYLMLFIKSVVGTDNILYYYMINEESITHEPNDKVQIDDRISAIRNLIDIFKKENEYDTYKEALTFVIYLSYTYMIEYYVYALDMNEISYDDFKKLHDFFFELVDYDYRDNKFINLLDKKKRMYAELNNYDYKMILDTIK